MAGESNTAGRNVLLFGGVAAGAYLLAKQSKPTPITPPPSSGNPPPVTPPAPGPTGSGYYPDGQHSMPPNTTLRSGGWLASPSGRFLLEMQTAGNLVLYDTQGGAHAIWYDSTSGTPGSTLAMQGDGNLVVHRPDGTAAWNSGTSGKPGAWLNLQDEGNAVIYLGTTPLWWTSFGVNTPAPTPTPTPITPPPPPAPVPPGFNPNANGWCIYVAALSAILNGPSQSYGSTVAQNALHALYYSGTGPYFKPGQNDANNAFQAAVYYKGYMLLNQGSSPAANANLTTIENTGINLVWGGSPPGWQVNQANGASCS